MTDQKQLDFINAWTIGAKDLGLIIRPLFNIPSDNGRTIERTLLVENFGSKLGTAIFTDIHKCPDSNFSAKGYYVSTLGDSYAKYRRDLFIDTLNDWGYYGDPKLKPDWFTGHYWGQKN
jgi:hypothetical protein